jgi:hypothetical protein
MPDIENITTLHNEDFLAPPKYDATGVLMVFLASLIVGLAMGIIIVLASYVTIGPFTLESGASPILLAFVTCMGLTIGNSIYTVVIEKIFPHIYMKGRTTLGQVVITSIILYILVIPLYLVISSSSLDARLVLAAFAVHVVLSNYSLVLILGIISRYRYVILSFYASLIALFITSIVLIFIFSLFSESSTSLFLLLGLPILSLTLTSTISAVIFWIYSFFYQMSGSDPIGAIYGKIEEEEKLLEKEATASLTHF